MYIRSTCTTSVVTALYLVVVVRFELVHKRELRMRRQELASVFVVLALIQQLRVLVCMERLGQVMVS